MCHEEPAGTPDPLWTPNIHRLNVELELDRISTSYCEEYEQVDLTGKNKEQEGLRSRTSN